MSDRFTIRTVVLALASGVILSLCIMGYLATTQTPIPDPLDRLAFLLAGALAGILSKTSMGAEPGDPPTPVTVENPPEDAVQVETAKPGR